MKRGGYLRPWEASRYLGIPIEEIYKMLEAGELPGEKIEGSWRIDLMKLERWLDEEVSPQELKKLAKRLNVSERQVKEFFKKAKESGPN